MLPCLYFVFYSSGLPYDVTQEQALQQAAVRDRIDRSIQNLQEMTERFLSVILKSVDTIPWVCLKFVFCILL